MADTPKIVSITIDGVATEVRAGELAIKAAEEHGTYIPRFCWHPRMKPVGMCRMCLVEVETPRGKLLTTSCTLPVNEGMIIHTESEVVTKAQEGILEFLLINHPLDCPVCDRGGECPLQDQTMAYGPGESRFVEEKRHFEKPIPISDIVLLDRERCILCARCTRFSEEISGDPLIEFKERGNTTQVLTFPDEPFASYFSGNTVQICPVGALTAKPYRFKARPWDLEAVESVSMVDPVGSKVSVQSSQNEVVRINGVDNEYTNQGWLSDKDRYIFEYINSDARLTVPLVRRDGELVEATWPEALEIVADRLGEYSGDEVGAIGGAHNTNEEAYALGKFLRKTVTTPHIDAQVGDGLDHQFAAAVVPRATIDDLERARTILVWGQDLKEEFPVLYLRVRRAATELGANLVVVHPRRNGLDGDATHVLRYRPGEGSDLLRKIRSGDETVADIAEALSAGPVVAIVGRASDAEDRRLAESVAAFARELPSATIMPLLRRGNIFGALDMGLAPTLLPGRRSVAAGRADLEAEWGPLPTTDGKDATGILQAAAGGEIKALVLTGTDPVNDHPTPGLAADAIDAADFVVAMDLFLTDTSRLADVVLPLEGFGETEGTVTNLEGRVQKVNRKVPGPGQSRALWAVVDDLTRRMGGTSSFPSAQTVAKEIATVAPAYRDITWELVDWGDGRDGVVVPTDSGISVLEYVPVDAGLSSKGGRYALHAGRSLYDDGVMVRMSPSLAALAPAPALAVHPRDAAVLAVADGDLVRVSGDHGSTELPVMIDDSLAERTVAVVANLPETRVLRGSLGVEIEVIR